MGFSLNNPPLSSPNPSALGASNHEYISITHRSIGDPCQNEEDHAIQVVVICEEKDYGSPLSLCLLEVEIDSVGSTLLKKPIAVAKYPPFVLTGVIPSGAEYCVDGRGDDFKSVEFLELKEPRE